MNHQDLAERALSKCDYVEHSNQLYKIYLEKKTDESLKEYQKSLKTLKLYEEAKKILEISKDDYYAILNVKKDASSDQIKKSYSKLLLKYHPDKTKLDICNNVIGRIIKAYEILSDQKKRENYDNNIKLKSMGPFFQDSQFRTSNFTTNTNFHRDFMEFFSEYNNVTSRSDNLGYMFNYSTVFSPFSNAQNRSYQRRSGNVNSRNFSAERRQSNETSGAIILYTLIILAVIISVIC